jgi:glycosyltransferase involved in cell wall biosynthesis
MSTPDSPAQLVIGPPRHGVTEYAEDLARAVLRRDPNVEILRFDTVDRALAALGPRRRVHAHVTDALFGADLEAAATAVERLTAAHAVSMTLHDVPQLSDGVVNLPRRAAAYRRFAAGGVGVAVASRHEAALLREHVSPGLVPAVLPLGTRLAHPPRTEASAGSGELEILIAGYVYPGKGHDDVLEAAAELVVRGAGPVRLTVLGGSVSGHEGEAERLAARATSAGVRLEITGYLDRVAYAARLARAGVPVVAHQHYSASRSLLDWAEAGRRALVVSSRYPDEMDALRPGTILLAAREPRLLADAIERAAADPASTRLSPDVRLAPTLDDVADASISWWRSLPW